MNVAFVGMAIAKIGTVYYSARASVRNGAGERKVYPPASTRDGSPLMPEYESGGGELVGRHARRG